MSMLSISFKSRPEINMGLHTGASSGNLGLVKFALDFGQPVDSVLNGWSPLHTACYYGHFSVVKYLIERGSDEDKKELFYITYPKVIGNYYNFSNVLRISGDIGTTPLHCSAYNGNADIVELLVLNGALINATDRYGSTALTIAQAKHNYAVVAYLQQFTPPSDLNVEHNVIDPSILSQTPIVTGRRKSLPDLLFGPNSPTVMAGFKANKALRNVFRFNSESESEVDLPINLTTHSSTTRLPLPTSNC